MAPRKGNIPWNKGTKGSQIGWNKGTAKALEPCIICGEILKSRFRRKRTGKCASCVARQRMLGKKLSIETRKKMSEKRKNPSFELRLRWSLAHRGAKSHLWKGGKTPIMRALRTSLEYKVWRKAVFERDNYTCQNPSCDVRGGKLNADHIKSFAFFPELRFAIENGRTLCVPCHRKTPTYGYGATKLAKEQNVPIKYVTGDNDSTWYEFPLTSIKRNLFGS